MLIKLLLTFLLVFSVIECRATTILGPWGDTASVSLAAGWCYSFAEPHTKNFHLAEIGIWNTKYNPMGMGTWYYGSEFGVTTDKFLLGPKVGAFFGFKPLFLLLIGGEMVFYTDFQEGTLRFVPYFGIGTEDFMLAIKPHLRLTNTDFEPIDRGLVCLTISIFDFFKKETAHHDPEKRTDTK